MITVEEVRNHCEVSLRSNMLFENGDYQYKNIGATFLCIENECPILLTFKFNKCCSIWKSKVRDISEEEVKSMIDWKEVKNIINNYFDLQKEDLLTREEWHNATIKNRGEGKKEYVKYIFDMTKDEEEANIEQSIAEGEADNRDAYEEREEEEYRYNERIR